jgi:lipoprotein-releasing system permease protein
LTKKIIDAKPYKNSISAPIIKIGVLAISISVLVMMVSVAVGLGMQKEIKDKISSIEGHINISSFRNIANENSINSIDPNQEFLNWLDNIPEISRVEKIITKFVELQMNLKEDILKESQLNIIFLK